MMKKKILIAIPISLICFHGTSQVTAQANCEQMNVPPVCQNAGGITINTQSRNIAPPNICAAPGQTINVNVVPNGTVTISAKNGGFPNGTGGAFNLVAPDVGDYNYNVIFEDGTCIDPRITVRR